VNNTTPKKYPILFSSAMVRAILDNQKSQTRRLVKPQPPEDWSPIGCERYEQMVVGRDGMEKPGKEIFGAYDEDWGVACPYGGPGDVLVPLTTWATEARFDSVKPTMVPTISHRKIWTLWDGLQKPEWCGRLRPGRFMPLWMREVLPRMSSISIRVQRLQDISEEDAIAEGALLPINWKHCPSDYIPKGLSTQRAMEATYSHRMFFAAIWDSINAKRAPWFVNPWVWVITFYRIGK
jgi:hypothetical protein